MRYKRYPSYVDASRDGIVELPAHWEVRRSDWALTSERRQIGPEEFASQDVFHYSIPVVQETGTGVLEEGASIASAKQVISEPVLLVSKLNPRKATVCIAGPKDVLTLCSSEFVVLKPRACDLRFLYYLALSEPFRQRLDAGVQSVTRSHQRANPEQVYRFWAAWPPLTEQLSIAAFLDNTTARIDTLLSKRRALVKRLYEKRAALISRTVMRGVPSNTADGAGSEERTELIPSGVKWLGDIPATWRVAPIKVLAVVGNGSTPSRENADYWGDGTYPWLNSSVVNKEQVLEASEFVTDTALQECHLPRISPPAVLVGITGEGRTRGMATTLLCEATINQHLVFIKPRNDGADVGYLRRVLDHAYLYLRNESDGGGSTKGAITCEQIQNLRIPVPPIREQRAIAAFLDAEIAMIDRMTAAVELAVDRLLEYRAAIITAAVTGKIDVRNASQNAEPTEAVA